MSKNAAITIALAARLQAGMNAREAIEDLFGPGAYDVIAGEIYDALRAKAGVQ